MSLISNFTKIRPVGAPLIHVDRWTDGDDEAFKHFSRLQISQLMLCKEILLFVLRSMQTTWLVCGQNVEFLNVELRGI